MDLKDQLKKLFPEHEVPEEAAGAPHAGIWLQDDPILCKYEKRRGKPLTILEGYTGAESDFQALARELKTTLGTGGSVKNDSIIIQGDFRDRIMEILKQKGFKTKRVGG
jgi:translation initiation factor 1